MKTIYFVRHGKSEGNQAGVISGQVDHPLVEDGKEEAKQTAKILPDDLTLIYSSDLLHCKQTSEILNNGRNLPIIYDERLRERNHGTFQGKTWEEIDTDGSIYKKDREQKYDYRPYGGESVEDVIKRVHSCIDDIKSNYPNEKVLVVTSAGVIRLLHHLYGKQERKILNASIHEFEL